MVTQASINIWRSDTLAPELYSHSLIPTPEQSGLCGWTSEHF